MPQPIVSQHTLGFGDHVSAGSEVDIVFGECRGCDLDTESVSGWQPDTSIPHRNLHLVYLARADWLFLVESVAIAQSHHTVAQSLREVVRVHVNKLRHNVRVGSRGIDI